MKQTHREKIKTNLAIICDHIKKYRILMIVISAIISLIALFFVVFWNFDETTSGGLGDTLYLASYISFLVVSLAMLVLLIIGKYIKIKPVAIAIILHVYVFLLIGWTTFVSLLDLMIGAHPLLFLIVFAFLSGFFLLEPIYYTLVSSTSFITLVIFALFNQYEFFQDDFKEETFILLGIYMFIVIFTSFRLFHISQREYKYQQELIKLTYYDQLTDLLNERSYLELVNEIGEQVKVNEVKKFAIIMMDVNNLKATNDKYGHRYGCSLVVRCGHTLPSLFKSSKLFHIGGDEFLAIVYDEDLEHFEELIKNLKETLEYSLVEYEGVELIFSVANGYAIYQEGDRYQDVLERADAEMYSNKKMLKEKYNMKGR